MGLGCVAASRTYNFGVLYSDGEWPTFVIRRAYFKMSDKEMCHKLERVSMSLETLSYQSSDVKFICQKIHKYLSAIRGNFSNTRENVEKLIKLSFPQSLVRIVSFFQSDPSCKDKLLIENSSLSISVLGNLLMNSIARKEMHHSPNFLSKLLSIFRKYKNVANLSKIFETLMARCVRTFANWSLDANVAETLMVDENILEDLKDVLNQAVMRPETLSILIRAIRVLGNEDRNIEKKIIKVISSGILSPVVTHLYTEYSKSGSTSSSVKSILRCLLHYLTLSIRLFNPKVQISSSTRTKNTSFHLVRMLGQLKGPELQTSSSDSLDDAPFYSFVVSVANESDFGEDIHMICISCLVQLSRVEWLRPILGQFDVINVFNREISNYDPKSSSSSSPDDSFQEVVIALCMYCSNSLGRRKLRISTSFSLLVQVLSNFQCHWHLTREILRSLLHFSYDSEGLRSLQTHSIIPKLVNVLNCFLEENCTSTVEPWKFEEKASIISSLKSSTVVDEYDEEIETIGDGKLSDVEDDENAEPIDSEIQKADEAFSTTTETLDKITHFRVNSPSYEAVREEFQEFIKWKDMWYENSNNSRDRNISPPPRETSSSSNVFYWRSNSNDDAFNHRQSSIYSPERMSPLRGIDCGGGSSYPTTSTSPIYSPPLASLSPVSNSYSPSQQLQHDPDSILYSPVFEDSDDENVDEDKDTEKSMNKSVSFAASLQTDSNNSSIFDDPVPSTSNRSMNEQDDDDYVETSFERFSSTLLGLPSSSTSLHDRFLISSSRKRLKRGSSSVGLSEEESSPVLLSKRSKVMRKDPSDDQSMLLQEDKIGCVNYSLQLLSLMSQHTSSSVTAGVQLQGGGGPTHHPDMSSSNLIFTLFKFYQTFIHQKCEKINEKSISEDCLSRITRILNRLTQSLECIKCVIMERHLSHIYEIKDKDSSDLYSRMAFNLSNLAESGFAQGQISHVLARGSDDEKRNVVISIPMVVRSKDLLRKFLFVNEGLDVLLYKCCGGDVGNQSVDFRHGVQSLHVLSSHLGVISPLAIMSDDDDPNLGRHNREMLGKCRYENRPSSSTPQSTNNLITFSVGAKLVENIDKDVLSEASPVFAAMLTSGSFIESKSDTVKFFDASHTQTVNILFHHLYGCCDISGVLKVEKDREKSSLPVECIFELMVLSDKYMLHKLFRLVLTHFYNECLNSENVVEIYKILLTSKYFIDDTPIFSEIFHEGIKFHESVLDQILVGGDNSSMESECGRVRCFHALISSKCKTDFLGDIQCRIRDKLCI